MQIDVGITGYRCFAKNALCLNLSPGIIALVGKNNAGKSAVLRAFLDLQSLLSTLPNDAQSLHNALNSKPAGFKGASSMLDPREFFPQGSGTEPMRVTLDWQVEAAAESVIHPCRAVFELARDLLVTQSFFQRGANMPQQFRPKSTTVDGARLCLGSLTTIPRQIIDLRPLSEVAACLSNLFYIPATRYAYGGEGDANAVGPLLGKTLVNKWSFLQSGAEKAPKAMLARVVADVCRLFDLGGSNIRATHNRDTLEIDTARGSFRLDEVGNGISQALLVLFNAATRNPSWIMIDEPENGLHAAAQRDFVLTLASYASQGVVFATHSLGLARSVADRVYHVHQKEDGMSKMSLLNDSPHLAELVAALGFGWHDSVEGRTVLVVEGPSDVRIYDRWMTTLGRAQRVLILNLGGSNGIRSDAEQELSQLKKLGGRVVVLLDSDRSEPNGPCGAQSERFAKCCGELGIQVHFTGLRCVESYFTQRAIDEAFPGKDVKAFGPFAAAKPLPWSTKTNGAHVAARMTQVEILETDVGQLLNSL